MADERRTKAILEFETRTDQAIRGVERLRDRIADIRQSLASVNQTTAKTGGDLRSVFDEMAETA
jgi:hypothetical protein